MAKRRPIETAPRDGSQVRVFWTNEDGEESESIARYRALDRLKLAGGYWDDADTGWWTFVDSKTQIRIEPNDWKPEGPDDEAE